MNKERFLKFTFMILGMNLVKQSQGEMSNICLGALLMAAPVIYEMTPFAKKFKNWLGSKGEDKEEEADVPFPMRRPGAEAKPAKPAETSQTPAASEFSRAMSVLNDTDLSRTTVTFEPGQLGFSLTSDGVVSSILEDSPAETLGVKRGWHVLAINNERPDHHAFKLHDPEAVSPVEELIVKYRGGFEKYTVTFLTEQETVDANVGVLDSMLEELQKEELQKAQQQDQETEADKDEGLRQRRPEEDQGDDKS